MDKILALAPEVRECPGWTVWKVLQQYLKNRFFEHSDNINANRMMQARMMEAPCK